MYLKSVNATDVYGNKIILGADEIIRCYKQVITDFMETRFFWIFQRAHEKFNKDAIRACARKACQVASLNLDVEPTAPADNFESRIFEMYKESELF